MTTRYHYQIQLKDMITGQAIITAGGKCYVAGSGVAAKQAITDSVGTAATNPLTPTRGAIDFWSVTQPVDLYIATPGGQFLVATGLYASGPNEVLIDTSNRHQCMAIPFAIADTAAATETASGFLEPTNAQILPGGIGVRVSTLDSGIVVDVGTLSSDSGDADGFIDGISLTSAALVKATDVNGAVTLGALMYVQDSANAGDDFPEAHTSGGKSITYTLSAGADTGQGFIYLPYLLCA